jgi:thymidine phosphorylase
VTFETACAIFRARDYRQFDNAAAIVITNARRGLSESEVVLLCKSLAASGENVRLPLDLAPFVDVPSSGGPASLTTLLCPLLVATFGFHVPKLSARGSVAGGIDTMGIIPGFDTKLSGSAFINALRKSRFAHAEPTKAFCPADKNLVEKRRARNMMANPQLATASLLAKKLATPNTCAVFDFRVGPAGNIGKTLAAARPAKQLFLSVAGKLDLHVEVVLTEGRVFPSSALGRLESLFLLWQILSNGDLLRVDKDHLSLCIKISAKACRLANPEKLSVSKIMTQLQQLLRSGEVQRRFLLHLAAQGATRRSFEELLKCRDNQQVVSVCCRESGHWIPPDLNRAKEWIKCEQNRVARRKSIEAQIGLSLCRTPGAKVKRGDVVIQLRYPQPLVVPNIPSWLGGMVAQLPPRKSRSYLG